MPKSTKAVDEEPEPVVPVISYEYDKFKNEANIFLKGFYDSN